MFFGREIALALLIAATGGAAHAAQAAQAAEPAGTAAPQQRSTASQAAAVQPAADTAAGADLALFFGGLGAIGFLTLRRGREND